MLRRVRRKILPRKTRRLISNFIWRFTGLGLLAGGVLITLWGILLFFKAHPTLGANGVPVDDSVEKATYIIVGLAASGLGYSILKMYHHSRGQIDSRYVKDDDKDSEADPV